MVSWDTRRLSSSGYWSFSHPEICSGDQFRISLLATMSRNLRFRASRQLFGRKIRNFFAVRTEKDASNYTFGALTVTPVVWTQACPRATIRDRAGEREGTDSFSQFGQARFSPPSGILGLGRILNGSRWACSISAPSISVCVKVWLHSGHVMTHLAMRNPC
jgi:hypothetical protein